MIERNRYNAVQEVATDHSLGTLRTDAVDYYLTWHYCYETLVGEAQRRNLIYRGTPKDTGIATQQTTKGRRNAKSK